MPMTRRMGQLCALEVGIQASPPMYSATWELRTWLLSRVWPERYDSLEVAFKNFRYVVGRFLRALPKACQGIRRHPHDRKVLPN
jgi:hypothetical protein